MQTNKTLKNIKTKLNAIQQKQASLEEKINEENDFKLSFNSNKRLFYTLLVVDVDLH